MEASRLELRAVSPRHGGGIAARRPLPTATFARPSPHAHAPGAPSIAEDVHLKYHRDRLYGPSNKLSTRHNLSPRSDDQRVVARNESDRREYQRTAEKALFRQEKRKREKPLSQLYNRKDIFRALWQRSNSVSSMSDSSVISDSTAYAHSSTASAADGPYMERSLTLPRDEYKDLRLSGAPLDGAKKQPKLSLFSRTDKGSLGPTESETSISTTISRDNTAGEHARHASLFAEYGRKIKSKEPRAATLPRPRPSPSPSLALESKTRPSGDKTWAEFRQEILMS